MTNKLVIRRLPPSISEEEFLKQVSPLPEHDYFCFFEADRSLGSHSFCRAYINFISPQDMSIFKERFDNYVFLDRNGHEYSAVVEQSLWHKTPRDGPFYRSVKDRDGGAGDKNASSSGDEELETETLSGLEHDPDFMEFAQKLKEPRRRKQQSPIQTLENNLDAIKNASNSNAAGKNGKAKVIPPLIGYVNQRRLAKNAKKRGK